MSSETIVLLRRALQAGSAQETRRLAAVERLREIRERSALPEAAMRAEQLVREDRDAIG